MGRFFFKNVVRKGRIHSILRKAAVVLCLVGTLFSVTPAKGEETKEIRLAAFNYPPFYWEEAGQVQGVAVDLVHELFSRMDRRVSLTLYPLKRALEYTREGRADGIMILIKTKERSVFLEYTDPVMTVRGLIWSRAGRPGGPVDFNRLEDLKDYKTGATLGYSYGQAMDNLLKTMEVERVASDYLNYRKLLAGRIDIFPGNEIVARGLFKRHKEFQGKFVHSDRSFIDWVLHMGISKKSSLVRDMPRINAILSDLRAEGFIDRVVKRYIE